MSSILRIPDLSTLKTDRTTRQTPPVRVAQMESR